MDDKNKIAETIIAPTLEVVQFLFDSGDINEQEFVKYLEDPTYCPSLNTDYEE